MHPAYRLNSRRSSAVNADPLLKYGWFRSAVPVRAHSRGPLVLRGRCPYFGCFLSGAMLGVTGSNRFLRGVLVGTAAVARRNLNRILTARELRDGKLEDKKEKRQEIITCGVSSAGRTVGTNCDRLVGIYRGGGVLGKMGLEGRWLCKATSSCSSHCRSHEASGKSLEDET